MENTQQQIAQVRWMIRSDFAEVQAIESRCDDPWDTDEYVKHLGLRNVIAMVVERTDGTGLAGLVVYALHKGRLEILRLLVSADCRRQRYGTAIVAKLMSKLRRQHRNRICMNAPDDRLDMHLFLRACSFLCVGITPEGDYRFSWRLSEWDGS